jgi:hypothetical protein
MRLGFVFTPFRIHLLILSPYFVLKSTFCVCMLIFLHENEESED